MVHNVTNAAVGQRWSYSNATRNGFVTYQGYQLQLWENPSPHSKPPEVEGKIAAVLTNAVVVQEFERVPSAYGLNEYGHNVAIDYMQKPTAKVVVQNVNTANAAEGDSVNYKVMRDGVTNYDGHTLQLWTRQQ